MATISEMDIQTEAAVVHESSRRAVEVKNRIAQVDGVHVFIDDDNNVKVFEALHKHLRDNASGPERLSGTSRHVTQESFVGHVNTYKTDTTKLWADPDKVNVQVIYDYHLRDLPRWREHRAIYSCPLSEQWKRWIEYSGKAFGQTEFAEFLDANFHDLQSPPADEDGAEPGAMLDVAQNLVINSKGTFKKVINRTTGEHVFVCKNEHDQESSTPIPKKFWIVIPVFRGGGVYAVEARVRFSLRDNRATFAYELHRADEISESAFSKVVETVQAATDPWIFGIA